MESPRLAVVIETWALLLFCRSAQVVNQMVTCSPSELTKPMGDTAVFTCKFANMTVSEYQPYLYREYNESQPKKITPLKEKQDRGKYDIVHVDLHTYKMKIQNLEKEDTGKYFFGFISISSARTVIESNRSNLTVTDKANTTVAPATQEAEEEKEEERGWNAKEIPLVFIWGIGVLLGLVFLIFLLFKAVRRKTGMSNCFAEEETRPAENAPLERAPPVATIFTVDYGILEFPAKSPPRRPPMEKTEYATIVFPTCEKSPKRQNYLDRAQLP